MANIFRITTEVFFFVKLYPITKLTLKFRISAFNQIKQCNGIVPASYDDQNRH